MPLNQEPIIHVGILASESIHFQLKGDFKLNRQEIPGGDYTSTLEENLISVGNIRQSQIILNPITKSSTFILKKVKIGIGFHWEQEEDQEFQGSLRLQAENGKIRAVNVIGLENYLQSVISSEMSAMNDLNLLKAHAIVSRSWLLAQIQNSKNNEIDCFDFSEEKSRNDSALIEVVKWYDREDHDTFDVCADDHCQRYQGITKAVSHNAHQAVTETHGQVLMYNEEICDARFSKCCGGITEKFGNVWQPLEVPYLTSVVDSFNAPMLPSDLEEFIESSPQAFCNTNDAAILSQVLIDYDQKTTDFFRWEKTYTQKELSALLEKKSGIHFGHILDLVPLQRGPSGRIIRLKIIGEEQQLIVGKELEIRKWLAESHLYSSAFVVEKLFESDQVIPSGFILRGAGWGHGVGMCQIGAAVMSHQGYNSTDILSHYFQSATLNKIY